MARKRRWKRGLGDGPRSVLALTVLLVVFAPGYAADVPWTSLLVGIGGAVAVVWLLRQLSRPTTPMARRLVARFGTVGAMSGAEFEVFIADLFEAMGHRATVTGGSGDQGVDVILHRGGERVAVQCKNHARPVGNRSVQQVYAGARHHGCSRAWAVAPAGFTEGAKALARSTEVALFDGCAIRRWIKAVDLLEAGQRRAPRRAPAAGAVGEARKLVFWHPHPDDPLP